MTLLVLTATLLLTVGLVVYGLHLHRRNVEEHQRLTAALIETRSRLNRAQDDLYVLRCLLEEKHLLDETDMTRGRTRFVDAPRRTQAERDEIARSLNVSPTSLVLDEDRDKVH